MLRRVLAVVILFAALGFSVQEVSAQDRKILSKRSIDPVQAQATLLLDEAKRLGPERVDSAFKLVEEALVWSIDAADLATEARCYLVLGELFAGQDQCDLAVGYFTKCAETHPDPQATVVNDARLAEGRCLVEMKRYLEARTVLEQLKGRIQGTSSAPLLPEINDLTARILTEIGEVGRADELLQENVRLAYTTGDKASSVRANTRLGTSMMRQDKRQEGLGLISYAWSATDSIVDPKVRYKAKSEIASAMKEVGEYDQARAFRQELASEPVQDTFMALCNGVELADVQRLSQNEAEAVGTYSTVLGQLNDGLTDDPRFLGLRVQALKNLSATHLELGNMQAAQRYLNEYISTMELADQEKRRKLEANLGLFSSLNASVQRMRLLEKDREINAKRIELLQAQGHLHTEQLFSRNAIIISLVLIVVLLSVVLVYRSRARRKEQLATRLVELRSLRAQMNPHFIFNALNAVNHYIAINDERRSNRYLTDLSGLMRKVLSYSELEFIDLEDEVELLEQYLRLEHDRFQDKFTWSLTVEPTLLNAGLRVPPMLVQPFIENAIWHGLRHKSSMGMLTVAITDAGDRIAFTITDDGIGRAKAGEIRKTSTNGSASKGIGNARNRIALVNTLYRTRITLSISDGAADGTGTRVHFELPKHLADVH